jgi:hypothetical protein
MIRVKGIFGFPEDEQEVIDISFYSGNELHNERVRDRTNYNYKFKSGYYPDWVHVILKDIAFKSNSLLVTDNCRLNKHTWQRKAILKDSEGYKPNYDNTYQLWYKVEVGFKDKNDDLGYSANCELSGNNCEPVIVKDGNGNIIDTIPSGGTYVDNTMGDAVTIQNSDNSYSDTTLCGTTFVLPDTTYNVYVDGTLEGTVTVTTLDPAEVININMN